jgi:hypothetical protein
MNDITLEMRITRDQSSEPEKAYLVSASEITSQGTVQTAQAKFTISSDIDQRFSQILVGSGLRDTQPPEGQTTRLKSLGIELFDCLFQSEVERLYRDIKAMAVRQQVVIRLRLQIVPAELSTLPWELLHDKEQYLCLRNRPTILFTRVPNIIVPKKALTYHPPLSHACQNRIAYIAPEQIKAHPCLASDQYSIATF